MQALWWTLGSVGLISILSLIGAITLLLTASRVKIVLYILVAFSAGAMMGGAFFHLLPEALSEISAMQTFTTMLLGFSLFFLLERLILWHHCHHNDTCKVHPFTYLNLVGDGIHNFIDGFIIAIAYSISLEVGMVATLAIILHEIPQELGDFGVLVYGGFRPKSALFLNFITAIFAIIGAIAGCLLKDTLGNYLPYVLPFAAGNFIYIAGSDLIPELHKEPQVSKSLFAFGFFIAGLLLMFSLKFIMHSAH